jgi:hypothetical protein
MNPLVCFQFGLVVEDHLDVVAHLLTKLRIDHIQTHEFLQDLVLFVFELCPSVNRQSTFR